MAKERSPNYPQIPLGEAVELIKRFFAAEGRTSVDGETAAKALGYTTVSGASRTKIAALKQYDLLQGRGDKLSITSLGMRIAHPDDDADYASALRDAAKSAELFASLLETHAEASDTAIVAYLVKTKNFTPDGARQATKAFKETIALAKLGGTPHTDEDNRADNLGGKGIGMQGRHEVSPTPLIPPPPGSVQRTFTTGSPTMDAVVTITSHTGEITVQDVEDVRDYLETLVQRWSRVRKASLTELGDGE